MKKKIQKIDKKTVEHIARLARLGLSGKEIFKYQRDLSKILGYIDKLKEVDISNIQPAYLLVKEKNIKRKDEVFLNQKNLKTKEKTIKLLPKIKDGYLRVKKII